MRRSNAVALEFEGDLALARDVLTKNNMSSRRGPQLVTASAVSWISLIAATALGVTGVDQVRTRVSARGHVQNDGELRLIVQSYRRDTLDQHQVPDAYAQPLASTQRAIMPEELRDGVDVSFLQLPSDGADMDSVVVAWVEHGSPTLDLDAMGARPPQGAFYGVGARSDGEIVLQTTRG